MIYITIILLIWIVVFLAIQKESVAETQIQAVNAFIESQRPPNSKERIKQLTAKHKEEIAELMAQIENLKS